MKRLLPLSAIVFAILFASSCKSDDTVTPDKHNAIKLSSRQAKFNAQADSLTLTTESDWWWIESIVSDDKTFDDFGNVNTLSNSYSLSHDFFIVARRDNHTLFIKLDENTTRQQRTVTVNLESGEFFDQISVTQSPQRPVSSK